MIGRVVVCDLGDSLVVWLHERFTRHFGRKEVVRINYMKYKESNDKETDAYVLCSAVFTRSPEPRSMYPWWHHIRFCGSKQGHVQTRSMSSIFAHKNRTSWKSITEDQWSLISSCDYKNASLIKTVRRVEKQIEFLFFSGVMFCLPITMYVVWYLMYYINFRW